MSIAAALSLSVAIGGGALSPQDGWRDDLDLAMTFCLGHADARDASLDAVYEVLVDEAYLADLDLTATIADAPSTFPTRQILARWPEGNLFYLTEILVAQQSRHQTTCTIFSQGVPEDKFAGRIDETLEAARADYHPNQGWTVVPPGGGYTRRWRRDFSVTANGRTYAVEVHVAANSTSLSVLRNQPIDMPR